MRDPNSKYIELHETLPSEPIVDMQRRAITFHGALYAFPDYSDEQLNGMVDQMSSANSSGKYTILNNLLDRLMQFKVGKSKRRRPGKRIIRGRMEIAKK